jgi:hypothetical protein
VKAYPSWFLMVLWVCFGLLAVSGVLLIPGMLELRLEMEVPDAWLPAARVRWAALHGFAAFAGVMAIGTLLPLHVRHGLRQRRSRVTGIALLCLWAVVIVSGWGIYYLIDELWSLWSSLTHTVIALVLIFMLTVHVVVGRRV